VPDQPDQADRPGRPVVRVLLDPGDQVRVVGRDDGQDLFAGQTAELLPDIHPAGQHRFAAQHPVAVPAADEHDRNLGAPVVPQVAPQLETLPRQPLRLITHQHPKSFSQNVFEKGVELDRPRRGLPPIPSASNRT
jgi:hypothetical protein